VCGLGWRVGGVIQGLQAWAAMADRARVVEE
jgi:hypothetical protein